jgi:hypothetical protein
MWYILLIWGNINYLLDQLGNSASVPEPENWLSSRATVFETDISYVTSQK